MSAYIEELRAAIRRIHGAETTHVSSVPVKETFQGKTVVISVAAPGRHYPTFRPSSGALLCHSMELLWTTFRFRASSEPLSGLDNKIVLCIGLQVFDPNGMVVVSIRLLGPSPRLLGSLIQCIWADSIFHNAAARSVRRP